MGSLILENGYRVEGAMFGHSGTAVGEAVFVTNAVGYQEILTNPVYMDRIVIMTYPLIGNYGINLEDMESGHMGLKGLVVRECCQKPNNFRCEMDLSGFLKQNKICGLAGLDTRALAKTLRQEGVMKALITDQPITDEGAAVLFKELTPRDTVKAVTTAARYSAGEGASHIGVLDLGLTRSLLNEILGRDAFVTVLPADTTAEEILTLGCDGLVITDGPGLTPTTDIAARTLKTLMGRLPMLAVGLGMQVLAEASGLPVKKLPYGRHGGSYPVKDNRTGRLYITAQHTDAIVSSLGSDFESWFTNVSDGSPAGMLHPVFPVVGLSFTPETGPAGTGFIYDAFIKHAEGVFINA